MSKSKDYEEFVDKFRIKKTTDDCYTPDNVYDAVSKYVASYYCKDASNFVRPFYPGGDYEHFTYGPDAIVVDNPPFSKLMEIIRFYVDHNIKFFLFAPALTLVEYTRYCTGIATGVDITYCNGAVVNTSFLTNLEFDDIALKSDSALYDAVFNANVENKKTNPKPKYYYPDHVVTSAMVNQYSKWGISFEIPRGHCHFTRALDDQKGHKKSIFGAGYIVSDYVAGLRKECDELLRVRDEYEKTKTWSLSDNEREIIAKLSKRDNFD